MAKPIKRKLKSVHDPKMGSTSAAVQRKQPAKAAGTKPATRKPATKAAASKTPATKPATRRAATKSTKDLTAADKKFNAARARVLKDRKEGTKARGTKKPAGAQLAERLKTHAAAVEAAQKTAAVNKLLQEKRKVVQNKNLKARQAATDANIKARGAARIKYIKAKKPVLKDGKIVTPKVAAPKYTPKKAKLAPMPRLVNGKIVTKPRVKKAADPDVKKGAKVGAKTRARGGAKAA